MLTRTTPKRFHWYRRSADQGHPLGQNNLGIRGEPLWVWSRFPTRWGVGPDRDAGAAGGPGSLTLGPPTNSFNGADKTAAEAGRDACAGANA